MNEDDFRQPSGKLLRSVEDRIKAGGTSEVFLNLVKAGFATTPFAGGLASLITDFIPNARFLRLEDFVAKLAKDLDTLKDQVDHAVFEREDFANLFEACSRGVADFPQREKADAFRGMIVNAAVDRAPSKPEIQEFFVSLARNLTAVHLRILNFLDSPRPYIKQLEMPESEMQGGFESMFVTLLPTIPVPIIRAAIDSLNQQGLISLDSHSFGAMTSARGFQLLGDRITDLGRDFVRFCRSPA